MNVSVMCKCRKPLHRNLISKILSLRSCLYSTNSNKKPDEAIPVIRFPMSIKNRLIKKNSGRKKKSFTSSTLQLAKPGKMFISSNQKEHTMLTNQFPTKFNPPVLTSKSWTSDRSPGRHFTIHATSENPSVGKSNISFSDLSLCKTLQQALQQSNITCPTAVQSKAIPEILSGQNVMFAAETGSGKTLAYLLPIMQKIFEVQSKQHASVSPIAVILVPTKELCLQVERMAKLLSVPVNLCSLHSPPKAKRFSIDGARIPEVVIATPIPLLLALKDRQLDFSRLRFAVIDECDTLLDDSFAKDMQSILSRFNIVNGLKTPLSSVESTQLIMCSATFPKYASTALEEILTMEHVREIRTGYLHRVPPHVTHAFLRVKPSEKLDRAIALIESTEHGQAVAFCNFRSSAQKLASACQQRGVAAVRVDSSLSGKDRHLAMREFQTEKSNVLIATDLASRGIDTTQVSHVINFEVPANVSDFIHRCGRVGRVGQKTGLTTTLVSRRWEIPLIMQIEEAARRREEIRDVSANIKQRHVARWREREAVPL